MNIELNNQTKSPVKKAFFAAIAKQTIHELIHELNYDFLKNNNLAVSIALVGAEEIKRLNKAYRKKNAVTDVLSFAEYKNSAGLKAAVDNLPRQLAGEIFLGELILCYDDIREYAKKEKVKLEKELAKVVSHGVLHLLGMRHGKKMFAIQEKAAENLSS